MADKKPAVDEIIARQNVAESRLTAAERKAVLARRLKAVNAANNNTPKMQRALNRLANNVNK